jgi:hypothetical protein
MTYAASEAKGGAPIELYRFVVPTGTPQIFTYTSSDTAVVFDAGAGDETYAPAVIKREQLVANQESTKIQTNVAVSVSLPVAQLFVNGAVPLVMTCTIFRFQRGADLTDPDNYVIPWTGTVAGWSGQGAEKTLAITPAQRIVQDTIPRFRIQLQCNHNFCDAGCTVVAATYTQTGTIMNMSTDGLTLTITLGTAAITVPKYNGGVVTFGSSGAFVETHTSSSSDTAVVVLLVPLPNLMVGSSVSLLRGCNRTYATCINDFANGPHHFGFPYILNSDPWTDGIAIVAAAG